MRTALILLAIIAAAHLLDAIAFRHLRIEGLNSEDIGRMFRVMGFVPLWLAAAIALVLHDWPGREVGEQPWRRGGLLLGAVLAGGAAAELLKLLFRRERPWAHDGEYVFRAFTERPFSTGGLGLPSSHALVAFAAAAMLSRLFPRARIVWWTLGWGCAFTRVAAGAHFLSDVVVAAVVAWLVVAALWNRWRPRPIASIDASPTERVHAR